MKRTVFYVVIFAMMVGLILVVYIQNKLKIAPEQAALPQAREETIKEVAKAKVPEPTVTGAKAKPVKGEFDIQNAFVEVANEAGGAVVAVSTERTQKIGFRRPRFRFRRFGSPFFEEEDPFEKFFEEFFGEREFTQKGLGSGFIIDKAGHVLTNHHVVEGADKINVTLPDGRSFVATVKGTDPRRDLAIVKIDAKDLPTIELGDSNLIQVGEWVVALGNPFGHVLRSAKPTVTAGIVSALHRQIPAPGGERGYLNMIQTDAAINRGNSGGPLCDLNGKVIGINVVIFSTTGGYQGMGFAIPINEAKDILDDLMKGKEIAYGWLGVSVQEVTPDIAKYFNLPDEKGALISHIVPQSPAEKAGLKEGDVVRTFGGKEIVVVHDLLREVGNTKVGEKVRIDIIHDRGKKTIEVKIGKRPTRIELAEGRGFEIPPEVEKWRGIEVAKITDEIAGELNLRDKEGVVIIDIDRSGPSYEAGLRKGDVLREINKIRIRNLKDYKRITQGVKGSALVRTDRGYFVVKEDEE